MLKSFINWLKGLFGKNEEACTCEDCICKKSVESIEKPAVVEKKVDNTKNVLEKKIENVNKKKEVINDVKIEKNDNALKNVEKVKRVQKNKTNKKQSEKVEKKVKKVSAESQQTEQVEKPKKKVTRKTTKKEVKEEEKKD